MKTTITPLHNYPTIPLDTPTSHQGSNWANPAEDHWLINTESFISLDLDQPSDDYHRTRQWLRMRFFFSMALAFFFENEGSEVQLTLRPCNKSSNLRQQIPLGHYWDYQALFSSSEDLAEMPELTPYAGHMAREFVFLLNQAIIKLGPEHEPSHIALTYDDDINLLIALEKEQPGFYHRYCRSKGLEHYEYD